MLKPLLISPAVLLLVLLPAPQQKPAHKPAASESATPATIQVEPPRPEIKQIYKFDCAICHGETGNGKTDLATSMNLNLLDWSNSASLAGKSDDELVKIIRGGKDKMPPEDASRAKDDEIKGLVKLIRTFGKAGAAPAAAPAEQPPAQPTTPGTTPTSPTGN